MEQELAAWVSHYSEVGATLKNMRRVGPVATAFNANVDAVLKISGRRLAELAQNLGLSWDDLTAAGENKLNQPQDVVKGIFKSFSRGIAEEWLTEDKAIYDWMAANLGYDRLQMGGQGGIVANALAVCGVEQVFCHCNSLPELQAQQFLKLPNLLSFDEKGAAKPAYQINRQQDVPLIHWIIEFDRGDVFEMDGHQISCPKANRFIATYDPLNLHLVMDENFVDYMNRQPLKAIVLSGYHALTSNSGGVALVEGSLPVIRRWQQNGALLHLEVASTQDKIVRQAIIDKIAASADSIGLNERETIDVLEVIGEEEWARICENDCTALNLFEAMLRIKDKVGCRRMQMHMYGLYITVQDRDFPLTAQQNRRGMCLAATIAASKAGRGHINEAGNLMWAQQIDPCALGIGELKKLAGYIGDPGFAASGIGHYQGYDIIAVPTLLVEKPLTLVGMGDTISSISLVGSLSSAN